MPDAAHFNILAKLFSLQLFSYNADIAVKLLYIDIRYDKYVQIYIITHIYTVMLFTKHLPDSLRPILPLPRQQATIV